MKALDENGVSPCRGREGGIAHMVRYGFIHTKEDIKFLVLFAMDLLPFPVSFSTIVDLTTWCDEGFGYFEAERGFLRDGPDRATSRRYPTKGETLYAITEKGREATRIFEKQLPIRSAKPHSALRCVSSARSGATPASTAVTEHGPNDLTVRMEMEQVFAVEMNVVSHGQAAMLERTFKGKRRGCLLNIAHRNDQKLRKRERSAKTFETHGSNSVCCLPAVSAAHCSPFYSAVCCPATCSV